MGRKICSKDKNGPIKMSTGEFIRSGNNEPSQPEANSTFFNNGPRERKPLTIIIKLLKVDSSEDQAL